jgi:Flp pilus assembly protein TadB
MLRRVSRHRGRYNVRAEARAMVLGLCLIAAVVAILHYRPPTWVVAALVAGPVVLLARRPLVVLARARGRRRQRNPDVDPSSR